MSNRRKSAGGKGRSATAAPSRKCIVTGALKSKDELLRFVVDPDGKLVPDLDECLPGRGLWLSAERDMVNTAYAKGLFSRAARHGVEVSADLAEQLEGLMVRRCLDLLGLARRAGEVAAGFDKAQAWLREGKGGVILQARDGAADGREKIKAIAPGMTTVDLFEARELGQALGRDNAVHVVLAHGRLAESLMTEAGRLMAFRQAGAKTEEIGQLS
jgi:predicted RNA-binding protein YlxR (DUF448 family)/ribosomal protein L30E